MSDELHALVDAYRAEMDTADDDPISTRRAILRGARLRYERRRLALAASVVLLLVATNATTFAWSTGRLDAVLAWMGATPATRVAAVASPPDRIEAAPPPTPSVDARRAAAEQPAELPAAPAASTPRRTAPEVASTRLRSRPRRPSPRRAERVPHAVEAPEVDLGQALADLEETEHTETEDVPTERAGTGTEERHAFERAHRLHFREADLRAARQAWEHYLRAYPEGRLVPEARFNRAICLLRLGQHDDAEAALDALARSRHHRRTQAAELLQALREGRIRSPR